MIIILLSVFAKERIVICLMFIYIYIYTNFVCWKFNFLFAEFAYQMVRFLNLPLARKRKLCSNQIFELEFNAAAYINKMVVHCDEVFLASEAKQDVLRVVGHDRKTAPSSTVEAMIFPLALVGK